MQTILSILNEVAATSSKNEKIAILKANADNFLLSRVFYLAYNKGIRFWQTERDKSVQSKLEVPSELGYILNELINTISTRKLTGHAARDQISLYACSLSDDDLEVFWRVIERDLRIGASESTANKVWPDLIPEQKFMLAESDMSRIKYPALCQLKADGVRAHMVWDGTAATLWTRGNNVVEVGGIFDANCKEIFGTQPGTLDGELVCYVDIASGPAPMDRKTSNGIINKAIKGTISPDEIDSVRFVAWDMLPVGFEKLAAEDRLLVLDVVMNNITGTRRIYKIESHLVCDEKEAYALYKKWRNAGAEGAILKNKAAKWVGKRTFDLCKMKAVIECEFRCVGIVEGTGKYAGKLGAIIVEDADSRIRCNVGTGFSDDERRALWTQATVGKIFTIAYNERITSKSGEKESLFLPRNMGERFDRAEPDGYEKIVATEQALLK